MRRPQINPTQLRKHSRIIEKRQDDVRVAGSRDQTDFGYSIDGYKGKSFETKYVCIMPNSMTPKWQHEKKTRVLRVVGGVGHYETYAEDGSVSVKPVTFGDEITIEPGVIYRIRSSPAKLEFFISQDAKYEAALKELAPAESVAEVTADDLAPIAQEDKTHQAIVALSVPDRGSRRNRAREQLAAQRGQTLEALRRPGERPATSESDFFRNGAGDSFNAMPVAHFDPEGAG